jgi:hypothetical protein
MATAISLEDMELEWEKDAKFDRTEPSAELARIPILHAKYNRFVNYHEMKIIQYTMALRPIENSVRAYYHSDLNTDKAALAALGRDPWPRKLHPADLSKYVAADPLVSELQMKIDIHSRVVKYGESIIWELSRRTTQLQTIVKWETRMQGQ